MKNILYYILNLTFPKFEKKIIKILRNEKKLIIFDVGCYKGVFVKTILKFIEKKKYKFFLFDINKNVKKYINTLLKFNKNCPKATKEKVIIIYIDKSFPLV